MLLSSLALVLCSCLNSCTPIAESKNYEELQSAATQMIDKASQEYDYEGFNLSLSDQESLIKQKLYQYAKENELYTISELANLKQSIELDDDYKKFDDIDTLFIKNEQNSPNPGGTGLGGGLFNKDPSSAKNDQKKDNTLAPKDNLTGPNLDYGDTSGTVKETYFFPELANDLSKATIATNYSIDKSNFFGIYCSKEACVGLYNAVTHFLNKQAIYKSNGIKGPLGTIAESLDYLSKVTLVGAALMNAAEKCIENMTVALIKLWGQFCNLFKTGGIIGVIVGTIIALIGTGCICLFCRMLRFGCKGKGFAIGWMVNNFLSWDWVYEELS